MTQRLRLSTFGLAFLLSGCLVDPPPGQVVVIRRPPPARVDVITAPPGPDFVWIRGYWTWSGSDYEWVDGRWDRPVRPDGDEARPDEGQAREHGNPHGAGRRRAKWKDGHWRHYRGGWVWEPGGWQR